MDYILKILYKNKTRKIITKLNKQWLYETKGNRVFQAHTGRSHIISFENKVWGVNEMCN